MRERINKREKGGHDINDKQERKERKEIEVKEERERVSCGFMPT